VLSEIETKRNALSDALRLIVTSRERTPRSPRWALAWKRALFRYASELQRTGDGNESTGTAAEKGAGE